MKLKNKIDLIFLKIISKIIGSKYSFLADDKIRYMFCKNKFNPKKIKVFKDKISGLKNTLSHNLSAFNHFQNDFIMQRSKRLIFALLADESINFKSKFLIIGPRTENEIYFLYSLGFTEIYAIDLISYSNKVQLGDMHKIPFPKNKFDAVICGWTLSYSKNPRKVIDEIVRVIKPHGRAAFGFEYFSKRELKRIKNKNNYRQNPLCISDEESCKDRINSIQDLLNIFNKRNRGKLFYHYDAFLKNKNEKFLYKKTGLHSSQVMCVMEILK